MEYIQLINDTRSMLPNIMAHHRIVRFASLKTYRGFCFIHFKVSVISLFSFTYIIPDMFHATKFSMTGVLCVRCHFAVFVCKLVAVNTNAVLVDCSSLNITISCALAEVFSTDMIIDSSLNTQSYEIIPTRCK